MTNNIKSTDLSGEAKRNTIGTFAVWLGWGLLLALAGVTAIHAITITMAYTNYSGGLFAGIRVAGVILTELFAVATAILLAAHVLRAKQKPVAIAVEITWVVFAGINLVSSFAIEHGGEVPTFVGGWVAYGLPISFLVIGSLFYVMLRLDPDASRADDEHELWEKFAAARHGAKIDVLDSEQMRAVLRQAEWLTQPKYIGGKLGLSAEQIAYLERHAPKLLDLNQNGIADVHEAQPAALPAPLPAAVPVAEMATNYPNGRGPGAVNH